MDDFSPGDFPRSHHTARRKLHPIMIVVAVIGTLLSAVAVAAVMGWLPVADESECAPSATRTAAIGVSPQLAPLFVREMPHDGLTGENTGLRSAVLRRQSISHSASTRNRRDRIEQTILSACNSF